ncbi:hypothetical protein CASFOL_024684 [Castilleja foliolosa]|uniref:PWWP domain-containing protein n=1 Tax=Castilleja foliolosa TaxID=1961234 RepID=A0ABD3CP07_9LAMI
MSTRNNGGPESPSNRENEAVGEGSAVPSTSTADFGGPVFCTVATAEEEARVSLVGAGNSVETRVSDNTNESRVLKVENEESRLSHTSGEALENQPSPPVSRAHDADKKDTDVRNGKSESKKLKSAVTDYDSILSEFDRFASKEGGEEAVGFGYEIGDMVWGKVKSHPWWPGHIYNEGFASPSVQRSKREGHVLVAFFGDSSYGWFDPAELVPFEENFAEKSRQTSSRTFVKAVEEAADELSRRQGLGLACCCRNKFNFCPSTVEGYFIVEVGDYEPGAYSLRQINKARVDFQTKEILSFVQQLALAPVTDQHWKIEFIKNRAKVLACRKALFEEFDETYAQAFGTVPVRPSRPTAPMAVDPSKAPLRGRQVFADTLGEGKNFVKPSKSKDQVEKDKYLFIRRDAPTHMKTKKMSSVQAGLSTHPLLVDGPGLSGIPLDSSTKSHMHQTSVSGLNDGQHQSSSDGASVMSGIKSSEVSRKLVEGGQKNAKVRKRHPGELSAENATLDMKKKKKIKKEIRNETVVKLPLSNSESGVAVEKAVDAAPNNEIDNRKKDDVESQQEVARRKVELSILLRDLRALALDPFPGVERNCPAPTQLVFLKYRSLVYQKSLVSLPPTGNETIEAHSSTLPALRGPTDKSTMKLMKPSARPIDDPTKGGKKRSPSDRPETIKKKKLSGDPNKRMKIVGSEDNTIKKTKKKIIIDDSKSVAMGKKIHQKSTESQSGGDVKERSVHLTVPKPVKLESSKRMIQQQPARASNNPAMLVMKFPAGATLPSGTELKAKFARFGALDLDATRVFWKTYTCRLVFRRKVDAEEALNSAVGSSNLFGSARVKCYVREMGVDGSMEPEPVKVQKEQSRESVFENNRPAAKTGGVQQSAQQLKSCLKRPSNDEGGNGNGRGTRVKFILGGGEGSSTTREQISSFNVAVGASSHNNEHFSIDASTSNKNLPKFTPQSSVVTSLPATTSSHQFQKFPINMSTTEQLPRSFNVHQPTQMPTTKDISLQLLNLLNRCSDVVNNLKGALGYMPYHAL